MYDAYFNVAKDGKHLFRTDVYEDDQTIARMRDHFRREYRSENGYEVTESRRFREWTVIEVRS